MSAVRRVVAWLSFKGRAGRWEYNFVLWPLLGLIGALTAWEYSRLAAGHEPTLGGVLRFLAVTMSLSVAAMVTIGRRLHDVGRSGQWVPMSMVALQLVHLAFTSLFPDVSIVVGRVLICSLAGVGMVHLALRPGDSEANEFGPPPRSRRNGRTIGDG